MACEHIRYDVAERVATLTLDRPDRLNAWTRLMEREVRAALEAATRADGVRVLMLTGAGRGYCRGPDAADARLCARTRRPGLAAVDAGDQGRRSGAR